jgi:heme exporter protein D
MTWLAVVGTLLGTVIGVCGTIATQQMAMRAAERRDRSQRLAALRSERKAAVDAFIDAAQEVERVAADSEVADHATKTSVGHRMWIRHKQLALICSDDLNGPLDDLANKLNQTLWHGVADGKPIYEYVGHEMWVFRNAARREIGTSEELLTA